MTRRTKKKQKAEKPSQELISLPEVKLLLNSTVTDMLIDNLYKMYVDMRTYKTIEEWLYVIEMYKKRPMNKNFIDFLNTHGRK
jgi:hypothetical protein